MDFPVSLWQSIMSSKQVLSRGRLLSLFLHVHKILDAPKISPCFYTVVTCFCNLHLQAWEQHTHSSFFVFALFPPLTLLSQKHVCMCFLMAGFHFLCAYLQYRVSDSISFHIYLCGEHTKFSANSLWFTASRIFVLLLSFLSCVRDFCVFPCLHIILCISGYQSILHLDVCANTTLHSLL